MNIHTIAKFIYGLFGGAFIIVGLSVAMFKSGFLPEWAEQTIVKLGDNNLNGIHLIQELGSLLVFAGLVSFWFIKNYEQSIGFHWALTAFWALLALAHWFDVRGMRSMTGPMINSIPFVLFTVVGILRSKK